MNVNYFILKIAFIFLGSLLFSVLINRIFLKFSKNLGIRNIDDKLIRWGTTSKPAFGGISFFIVFLLGFSFYQVIFPNAKSPIDLKLMGIIMASSLGFLVGLADDAYNTNPTLKSIAQALCGIILISTGTFIDIFDHNWIDYILTFIWVVGLMNSINMLDNMDAVSTVASISALSCMLLVMIMDTNYSIVLFTIVVGLIGALLGFLFFNWNPSKMYMGDTGSQFLGIILASLSIPLLWNHSLMDEEVVSRQFILPAIAFIVPLSDTTTVVVNRLLEKRSPFIGGKDHSTHHLSYLGLSDQSVALLLAGIGLFSAVVLLMAISITEWTHLFTILFSLYVILVFLSLFLVTKYEKLKKSKNPQNEQEYPNSKSA